MNKTRLLFSSLLLLLILGNIYTQDTVKKSKKVNTESAQQTQETLQASPTAKKANVDPAQVPQEPKATTPAAVAEAPLKFFVFTESCYNKFANGKIDAECVKSTLSLALSYAIILLAVLFQGLQIIKLLSSRSIKGLSLSVFYRELLMVMLTLGYNLHIKAPTHTYCENISIFVQTTILIFLYWILNPKTSKICVIASLATYGAIGAVLYLDILSSFLNELVLMVNIGMIIKTVLPQIKVNHQNKGAEVAFGVVFLTWATYLARSFTTYQEVKDDLLLAFYGTGVVLYGIVLLQSFMYGKSKIPQKVDNKKRE